MMAMLLSETGVSQSTEMVGAGGSGGAIAERGGYDGVGVKRR